MTDLYVCVPVQVCDKPKSDEPRFYLVTSKSEIATDVESARKRAAGIWGHDIAEIVVVMHVDSILNVSVYAMFGWHRLSSRYDLPGNVQQIDRAMYDLAVEARLRADEFIHKQETV